MKIHTFLIELDALETAALIHIASGAISQKLTLAQAYASLGTYIEILDDSGFLDESIENITDRKELVNLITMASFRLQTLYK